MERERVVTIVKEMGTSRQRTPEGFAKFYRALFQSDVETIIEGFALLKGFSGETESIETLRNFAKIVIEENDGSIPAEGTIAGEAYKLLDESYIDHHFAVAMVYIARVGYISERPDFDSSEKGHLRNLLGSASNYLDKSGVYKDTLLNGLDLYVKASL